jgi:hypothetical protein
MIYYTISHRSLDPTFNLYQFKCKTLDIALQKLSESLEAQGKDRTKIDKQQIDLNSALYYGVKQAYNSKSELVDIRDTNYQYSIVKHFN